MHKINESKQRKQLLKDAKKTGVATLDEAQKTKVTLTIEKSSAISSYTKFLRKKGSTRSYVHSTVSRKLLSSQPLPTFDGGSKSPPEAYQISTDISKYKSFADIHKFSWDHLLDVDRMKMYVHKLENDSIGPDGILSKLDDLQTGVNYIMRVLPKCNASQEGKQALERVQLWKSSFQTKKVQHGKQKAVREKDTAEEDFRNMRELINCAEGVQRVNEIL